MEHDKAIENDPQILMDGFVNVLEKSDGKSSQKNYMGVAHKNLIKLSNYC